MHSVPRELVATVWGGGNVAPILCIQVLDRLTSEGL